MDYRSFSNAALLARLRELAVRERNSVSDFVACLAEADRRAEAILNEGYPSLFDFCVRDLKLAESTAYQRVKAAKLARIRPEILSLLADGAINLSGLCLIAPRLEEHPALLLRIVGKTKREIEALVASLGVPREAPDRMRPLAPAVPAKREESLFCAPPSRDAAHDTPPPPSAPARAEDIPSFEPRMEFRFAAGPRFVEVVERLRALLWHKHPEGRLEDLLYEAASDFLARRDPARQTERAVGRRAPAQRRRSRRIPAAVRRAVWRRDAGQCSFSGPAGRCGEARSLEIDHVTPWALGGRSDQVSNLRLLCRAHNQCEAIRIFGKRASLPG
jgi:hypothetical protein